MNRRQLLLSSTALGLAPLATPAFAGVSAAAAAGSARAGGEVGAPLPVPSVGPIPVAFLVSEGAVVIDFCGPWEVFESVQVSGRQDAAFTVYTVADTTRALRAKIGRASCRERV